MQLARLGVEEDGLKGAGVQAEQRVRQRAVAPEEAGQVEADEEFDQSIQQPVGRAEPVGVGVQRAVGRRILEEASAQHGVELDAVVGVPVDDDAQRFDRRDAELREPTKEAVLASGQRFVHLFQGVQAAQLANETDYVAGGAAIADLDQPLVLPFLERELPGQGEKAGGHVGGRSEHVAHGFSFHDRGALANLIGPHVCIVVGLWRCRPGRQRPAGGRSAGLSSPSSLLWQCSWSTRLCTPARQSPRPLSTARPGSTRSCLK